MSKVEVKFNRGFSLNGKWYKKADVATMSTSMATALVDKGIVSYNHRKQNTKKDK